MTEQLITPACTNKGVDWPREMCEAHLTLHGYMPRWNRNTGQWVLWSEAQRRMLRPLRVGKMQACADEYWRNNIPSLSERDGYGVSFELLFLQQAVERTLESDDGH
jgi:hypothetical protein